MNTTLRLVLMPVVAAVVLQGCVAYPEAQISRRTKLGGQINNRPSKFVTWEGAHIHGGRDGLWFPINEFGSVILGAAPDLPPKKPIKLDADGTTYKWVHVREPQQAGRWAPAVLDTGRLWAAEKRETSNRHATAGEPTYRSMSQTAVPRPIHISSHRPRLKTFIREYTYLASERDSKRAARDAALTEAKRALIEEIGMAITSTQSDRVSEVDGRLSEAYTKTIETWATYITRSRILAQNWDGQEFWIKAEIVVDVGSMVL